MFFSYSLFGIGDIYVSINLGVKLTLKDVRLILDLPLNLLFVGKFDEEGYTSCFDQGCWKLTKGALVQAKESVALFTKPNCTWRKVIST